MLDTMKGILSAEAEARRLVEDAKHEAARIMREAKTQAQTLSGSMAAQAKAESEALLAESEKIAEVEKREALERKARQFESEIPLDAKAIEKIADGLAGLICGKQGSQSAFSE